MRLLVAPGVFRPRSDSWMLAAALRDETLSPGARVLDLCTGSGLLALCAAQRGWDVTAVDRSWQAVWTVRANALLNGVRVRARRGDLFDAGGDRFDLIVANPPYVPARDDALPSGGARMAWDAGRDGRAVLDRICAQAPAHLLPGGTVLLTHSSVCGEERTLRALRAGGLTAAVVARRRGPLGPLLRQRVTLLEERGLLTHGRTEEEVLVIRGRAPRGWGAPTPPAR